jgi:hypothetical protein
MKLPATKEILPKAEKSLLEILYQNNYVCKLQLTVFAKKTHKPHIFTRFLQYVEFFAYLLVKAGFSYSLLNDNQAGNGGKEV